ncbi:hypothetical protein [Winogradskyella sp. Asnod2-B02-A]|uniref:hypothetical protein n=1 Tax=Winogradskyella sp. Asnod2-B02-A TaxID=3160583 RepID=UPI003867E7A2
MNDNKNIDRLFQEKFKDFEVAPNDAVWDRINESLPKKKKKRRVIALWWQIGGVAAVIALMITVGVSVFNTDENNSQEFPVANTDETDNILEKNNDNTSTPKKDIELNVAKDNNSKIVDSNSDNKEKPNSKESDNNLQKANPSHQLTTSNHANQSDNVATNDSNVKDKTKATQKHLTTSPVKDDKNNTKVAHKKASNSTLNKADKTPLKSEAERKSTIKKTIEENKSAIAENISTEKTATDITQTDLNETDDQKSENLLIEDSKKESINEAIAENNEIIEEEKENEQNRWSIAPNVAPVYFSSLGQGSALDKQFKENSKSSDINMSYGIAGSYAVSKKLKVRIGVNRVNLSQTTSDVYAFTGAETAARGIDAEFKNISFKGGEQHISLMSSSMMNRASTPELFNTKFAGNIDQNFGFIEVPLELEYSVLDKKIGINIIGGFSTFILNENEIYADVDGTTTLIGEANNIKNTSFSANFGLGIDYNLSKKWNVNLEPTFKYQINTFNDTSGDFRPFFIGVYTGLSYKF